MMQPLVRFCRTHALPWGADVEHKFERYLALLLQFNLGSNLIGPMSPDAIVRELLVDSLTAAAAARPDGPILDVGTGAGLPGIPLKLVFPQLPITLVEPRRKRATFLRIVATRLELSDVTIENKRIEELEDARYDYVISKAFQPPLDWIETASQWRSDHGLVVCMTRPYELPGLQARAGELGLRERGRFEDAEQDRAVYAFGA